MSLVLGKNKKPKPIFLFFKASKLKASSQLHHLDIGEINTSFADCTHFETILGIVNEIFHFLQSIFVHCTYSSRIVVVPPQRSNLWAAGCHPMPVKTNEELVNGIPRNDGLNHSYVCFFTLFFIVLDNKLLLFWCCTTFKQHHLVGSSFTMLLPLQLLAAFGIIFLSEAEPQLKRYNGTNLQLWISDFPPNFTTSYVIPLC